MPHLKPGLQPSLCAGLTLQGSFLVPKAQIWVLRGNRATWAFAQTFPHRATDSHSKRSRSYWAVNSEPAAGCGSCAGYSDLPGSPFGPWSCSGFCPLSCLVTTVFPGWKALNPGL